MDRFKVAERWGANIRKESELLAEVWRREKVEGKKVDVKRVMEETTGRFIL